MTSVHRSIFFSAAERYASFVLFFGATAVLSRLLTPREFGIYAVVGAITSVVGFSSQEFGGSNYLIQKSTLSEGNVRTAFTIMFSLSVVIGLVLYSLGDLFGSLFGKQELRAGISIAAFSFAITPFSMTIVALLRRDMQFGIIAVGNLAGSFATVGVSIALAVMGYSFLAPIWGSVAGAAVQTAYFMTAERGNLRIFLPSLEGYPEVVKFGLYSSGVVLINVFYSSAPQLFLARILDFTAVGLYSRAVNLTQLFDKLVTQVVSPVIMPAIFAANKAGTELKQIYLHAISLLTVLYWPFLILAIALAEPIVSVWLGPSWLEVVPLVRLLCVGYISLFAASLTYPILVAVGRVHDALISSLISLPPSLLLIFTASFFGVEAVAASALLTLPFQAAVAIYFIGGHLDLRFVDIVRATLKSAMVTLCTGAAGTLAAAAIDYGVIGQLAGLFVGVAGAACAWLAAVVAVQHPLLPSLKTAANGLLSVAWRFGAAVLVPTVRPDRDVY